MQNLTLFSVLLSGSEKTTWARMNYYFTLNGAARSRLIMY